MKCCHFGGKATSSGKTSLSGPVIIYPFFSNGPVAFFAKKGRDAVIARKAGAGKDGYLPGLL